MALKSIIPQTFNYPLAQYMGEAFSHYDLSAPYQRGEVWSVTQKQNLIKSLLMGLPVGGVFGNYLDYDPAFPNRSHRVIDGKQRIMAVRDFETEMYGIPHEWLDEGLQVGPSSGEIEYEGRKCPGAKISDLTTLGRRAFEMCMLPMHQVRLPNISSEADLYLLINFGGVPQTEVDHKRAQDLSSHGI